MELKLNSVIIIAVLLSANVFADNIPNTFEAGEAIKASEMNENFVDLQNQIDVLKAQIEAGDESESSRTFVGLTSFQTNGDAGFSLDGGGTFYRGISAMNKRCDIEYSESVMCTWEELESSPPDDLLSVQQYAWRRSSLTSQSSQGVNVDPGTGANEGYLNSCSSWTSSSSGNGAQLGASESIFRASDGGCQDVIPIACCK